MSEDEKSSMAKLAVMAVQLVGQEVANKYFTPLSLLQILAMFRSNNYNILDDDLMSIGVGLYPYLSLLNHSCSPNAVIIFDGNIARLRAITAIESGEEITISYMEKAFRTEVRQAKLFKHFKFKCDCKLCMDIEADNRLNQFKDSNLSEHEKNLNLDEGRKLMKISKKEQSAQKRQELLFKAEGKLVPLLHDIHYDLFTLYDSIGRTAIELQDWDTAKKYLYKTIPICDSIYPLYWPPRGIQYLTLGKLENMLEHNDETIFLLQKAEESLSATMKNTARYEELTVMFYQAHLSKEIHESSK